MRVGFVEWPEGLEPQTPAWNTIADRLADAQVDLLITNELPFGPWIAGRLPFDRASAQASIDAHAAGIDALMQLPVSAIVSSRPVWGPNRLLNQAIAIEAGQTRPIHTKQYFPEEPGWFEASWYEPGPQRFEAADVAGLRIGVLLCTDAMFNEHARHYGRAETALIALPRATGTDTETWLLAGRMAALVSGSYVVSSNRSGGPFGGAGFAIRPDGTLLTTTDPTNPLRVIDLDPNLPTRQRTQYPCYVTDPGLLPRSS